MKGENAADAFAPDAGAGRLESTPEESRPELSEAPPQKKPKITLCAYFVLNVTHTRSYMKLARIYYILCENKLQKNYCVKPQTLKMSLVYIRRLKARP